MDTNLKQSWKRLRELIKPSFCKFKNLIKFVLNKYCKI